MEKKTAAKLLNGLIDSGQKIAPSDDGKRSRWRLDCRAGLERVFGKESRQVQEYLAVDLSVGMLALDANGQCQLTPAMQRGHRQSLTILESALNEVEQFWELDQATVGIDPLRLIERLCERFHVVARQLRHRHVNRPTLVLRRNYRKSRLITISSTGLNLRLPFASYYAAYCPTSAASAEDTL
jgi:hypothetical protein